MKIRRCMLAVLLALASLQAAEPATMLKEDESATLFPALGWRNPAGDAWLIECHGWVYEREPRTASVAVLQNLLGMKLDDLSAEEEDLFKERARWFMVDNERGKNLHLILAGQAIDLGRTEANGHVEKIVTLPDTASRGRGVPAGTNVTTLKMAGADKRVIEGRVHLIDEQGWTVVSDIDDTIKVTEVRDRELLVRNTFCREFQPVGGMAKVYAEWAKQGAVFHYVSASPWQLYPHLEAFRAAHGFPAGTFHLRHFRLKDQSGREFLKNSKEFKVAEIGRLLERFPKRRFVLVGDSGEHDPEIYGELARKHPEQLSHVFIRDVTGEAAGVERYRTAFQGVAPGRWTVFKRPDEVAQAEPISLNNTDGTSTDERLTGLQRVSVSPEFGRQALIDATGTCLERGAALHAEAILRTHHAGATDLSHRLRLLEMWVWSARAAGRLKELELSLKNDYTATPDSAVAALEYAIAGATDYPSKRKAAADATRLAMDAAVLREIVNSQEQAGEWMLALAAAERWQEIAPSPEAACRLAALHLAVGDPAEGWRLANGAIDISGLRAEDVMRVAKVACQMNDWRGAADYLAKAAIKFPQFIAVRGLHAVAAEECGRDAEAAAGFLAMLALRDAVMPTSPQRRGQLAAARNEPGDVPTGTGDFRALETWTSLAYTHRQQASHPMGRDRFGPEPVVQLPGTNAELRAFAIVHLRELAKLDAIRHEAVAERLHATGNDSLAAAVSAMPNPGEHPDNAPMHAWALTRWSFTSSSDRAGIARRSIGMFSDIHPALAFKAALELGNEAGPEQEQFQQRAWEQFNLALQKAPADVLTQDRDVISATKDWKNSKRWQQAMIDIKTKQLVDTPDDAGKFSPRDDDKLNRHSAVHALLSTLSETGRWQEYAHVVEQEALAHRIPEYAVSRPRMRLDEQAMDFPHILTRWPACVVDLTGVNHRPATRAAQMERARQWTPHLRDPWLRLVTQRQYGDAEAAKAGIERRLSAPEAGLLEWWIGAWFAWDADAEFADDASEQAATRLAAERLAKASQFHVEGEARARLDAALLRAVLALKERPPPLMIAAREAVGRLSALPMASTYEAGDLVKACDYLGFKEEALSVAKQAVIPVTAEVFQYQPQARIPGTAELLLRGNPFAQPLSKDDAIATRQLLRSTRTAAATSGSVGKQLIEIANKRNLSTALLAAIAPPQDATAREHLHAGRLFEVLGEYDRAKAQHETAVRLQPGLDESRAILALLALPNHLDVALEHMNAMPVESASKVFDKLWNVSPPIQAELATRWLQHLSDAKIELSVAPNFLPRLLLAQPASPAHQVLWQAAAKHPYLLELAISAMAEDALRKHESLIGIATMARGYLESEDKSIPRYSLQSASRALPRDGLVTQPTPLLIVLLDAWGRNAGAELDGIAAMQCDEARLSRDLFFCDPERFPDAARAFLGSESARRALTGNAFTDVFSEGGTFDFITTVWRFRKLEVPLDSLIFDELSKPEASGSSMSAVATYLDLVQPISGSIESFLSRLRDDWVSADPARRRVLLHATLGRSGYEQGEARWKRTLDVPQRVRRYASLLRELLLRPRTCRAALRLAEEDGLISNAAWRANSGQLFSLTADTKPEDLLSLMDEYDLLGEAKDFRAWGIDGDPSNTLFERAVDTLHRSEEVCKAALALLKARNSSFGRDLALVWHAYRRSPDVTQRHAALTVFLNQHAKDFAAIPVQRWPEIAPLFRVETFHKPDGFGQYISWRRPWTVSGNHPELMPLAEAEERHLIRVGEQVLTLKHWEDFGKSGNEFCELSAHSFIVLSGKNRKQAMELADHVLDLLAQPSKTPGPRHVNTPDDLHLEWIFRSAHSTTQAIGVLREAMARSASIKNDTPEHRGKLIQMVDGAERALASFSRNKAGK